jgi:hypothetical protein
MGHYGPQVLHSCVTTTETMRRAIQNSKESLKKLSEKYSVNKKMLSTSNIPNHVKKLDFLDMSDIIIL